MDYFHTDVLSGTRNVSWEIYNEVDEEGWESRKVYIYGDGQIEFADDTGGTGGIFLSDQELPGIAETNATGRFAVKRITAELFETVWQRALETGKTREPEVPLRPRLADRDKPTE